MKVTGTATTYGQLARELMARKANSGEGPEAWDVVESPEPNVWYDWACPETGKVGQCCHATFGWFQTPGGTAPVVLRYRRRRARVRRTRTTEEPR